MRFAFVIFHYFPFGGLQRDMLAIANEAIQRGHSVTVFCSDWRGDKPVGINIVIVPVKKKLFGIVKKFVDNFQRVFERNNFDLLIGFNKIPDLDIYFAGDSCFAQKTYEERNIFYRFTPRARLYLQYEKAVFGIESKTKIFSLSNAEQQHFIRYYSTARERFYPLPPGISPMQFECENPASARAKIRTELAITATAKVILCLGSGFKTKGLDRSINAFAAISPKLPIGSILCVVGDDNPHAYVAQAQRLGIDRQIRFLGGRSDIAAILQAADVLLHPAYRELAGNVILEAMAAGKPVITTDVCGFAHYVNEFNMGQVITAPYEQQTIATALENVNHVAAEVWRQRAQHFLATSDVFSRQVRALDYMEKAVVQQHASAQEIISISPNATYILRDELTVLAEQENIFAYMDNLSGPIAREFYDRQTLRFELNGKAYYRKFHRGIGWGEIIKNLLQGRLPVVGAKNEWDALNKLQALDIPTLEPVAYGVQGVNPAYKKSFIVTRELVNVIQADDFFQKNKSNVKEKRLLIQKIAEIVRAMHHAGINHRDLYLCHFMIDMTSIVQWRTEYNDPKVYLVDLHRAQLRYKVPWRWLIKDLGGLYFSSLELGFKRNDYLRFMQVYWQLSLKQILLDHHNLLKAVESRAIKTYSRDFGVKPDLPMTLIH